MVARLCARVGCTERAVAVLLMYPREQQAWLVDLDAGSERFGIALCTRHAEAVTAPVGWTFSDDRTEQPELPLEPVDEPAEAPTAEDAAPSEPADPAAADADDEEPTLWEAGDEDTPLLSRAFRAAGVSD